MQIHGEVRQILRPSREPKQNAQFAQHRLLQHTLQREHRLLRHHSQPRQEGGQREDHRQNRLRRLQLLRFRGLQGLRPAGPEDNRRRPQDPPEKVLPARVPRRPETAQPPPAEILAAGLRLAREPTEAAGKRPGAGPLPPPRENLQAGHREARGQAQRGPDEPAVPREVRGAKTAPSEADQQQPVPAVDEEAGGAAVAEVRGREGGEEGPELRRGRRERGGRAAEGQRAEAAATEAARRSAADGEADTGDTEHRAEAAAEQEVCGGTIDTGNST